MTRTDPIAGAALAPPSRLWRTRAWWLGPVALSALASCGGYYGPSTVEMSPTTREELRTLERRQREAVADFDGLVVASDRCDDLCEHRAQICALADKICRIAGRLQRHVDAARACERAQQTCRETGRRTPSECACAAPRAPP